MPGADHRLAGMSIVIRLDLQKIPDQAQLEIVYA